MTLRKTLAALFGFAAGIVTAPIAFVVWPLFLAWFAYNETEA